MKNKLSEELLETMRKNPSNWRGIFYLNPKDPRLIVPKLEPRLGWTFNFGNIYSYLTVLLIIIAVIWKVFL